MSLERPWLQSYPNGVPAEIDVNEFHSVSAVFDASVAKFRDRPAYSSFGKVLTYGETDALVEQFAAYLLGELKLKKGDRVALMMPNCLQYPVATFGVLRAGLTVVNVNPLYTARELKHQLVDSGAAVLVVVDNFGDTVQQVIADTPIKQVITTGLGDMLGLKGVVVNFVLKYIKKMVPNYTLRGAIRFNQALKLGSGHTLPKVELDHDDVAFLQYTGGTTGVAKGAMLTHRNIVANMLQCKALMGANLNDGSEVLIAPLPLYHIYAFTFHCMAMMLSGNHNILISNPRDLPAMIKDLGKYRFSGFVGLNTLFVALCNSEDFRKLDFSALKVTLSGGMALQLATAERWKQVTGCPICEGYGLTETSPVASVNPIEHIQLGSIGIPVPSTQFKVINDDGQELAQGEIGELCIKGPQVMKGYWQRPEATDEVIDADGWFKTGDIGVIQEDGYIRIVDRKKDLIIVSGFNVYPNEIEEVVMAHPKVAACAAIGVADEKSGEAVKLFVVPSDPTLTQEELHAYCRENFTGYKMPRHYVFRDALPMTPVGKILRRELRESA